MKPVMTNANVCLDVKMHLGRHLAYFLDLYADASSSFFDEFEAFGFGVVVQSIMTLTFHRRVR